MVIIITPAAGALALIALLLMAPVLYHAADAKNIIGTNRDDVLRGTSKSDTIKGKGGNDLIYGLASSDNLYGGSGNDKVFGANGNDNLYGWYGSNYLDGGPGRDTIYGTGAPTGACSERSCHPFQKNTIYGRGGSDTVILSYVDTITGADATVYGGPGNDRIQATGDSISFVIRGQQDNDYIALQGDSGMKVYGGPGNDEIHTRGDGNVQVYGGTGNDRIFDNSAPEGGRLFGESGNDYFELRDGEMTVTGGPGADTFVCRPHGTNTITDYNPDEGDTIQGPCEGPGIYYPLLESQAPNNATNATTPTNNATEPQPQPQPEPEPQPEPPAPPSTDDDDDNNGRGQANSTLSVGGE